MKASADHGSTSRRLAAQILRRMGETGQPPERGALRVNVGTEGLLEVLRVEYLESIRESGTYSAFKLVQAPYGGGKTQFLHCLREIAWNEGFVTALVSVSPKECPFDEPAKIYHAVATSLESPPSTFDVESDRGLDALLREQLSRRRKSNSDDDVREWLQTELAEARVDCHALRRAAVQYMISILDKKHEVRELLGSFLRGEDVRAEEVRALGIRETLDVSSGFRFLRSLVQLVRALDVPGVVLMFDEMDRVMSLPRGRVRAIGDNLRQMIDHCGQATLPALLWVYAVPPEFMTNVVPQYPALEQRLKGASVLSFVNPLAPIIDLDRLALAPAAILEQIGGRLLELHTEVHGPFLDLELQRRNLQGLARELGERQLEAGTRRTFVKAAVQMLSEQHRGGERSLDQAQIRASTKAASAEADPALEGEEIVH
ncbi:MAG: DUF2791 family P-loop domain-containing protein [Deltaproteobacteria bacterium]|nr:DUF2791 family P-loop domain-containing protein [Deltaproteobacteria bacterium]